MEETVYNPQKGRLETIQVEYTEENTTWFDDYTNNQDIYRITDFDGGLLIKEYDYSYPVWVYDVSRSEINYDQNKAKEIRAQYIE
jgi:prophage tail gpP-like protein